MTSRWTERVQLLIFLDLSVVFNSMNKRPFWTTYFNSFQSYLEGRFQKIVLEYCCSLPWFRHTGSPQGPIMSLVLFNIYMKTWSGHLEISAGLSQYVENTQLCLVIPADLNSLDKPRTSSWSQFWGGCRLINYWSLVLKRQKCSWWAEGLNWDFRDRRIPRMSRCYFQPWL